MGKGIFQIFFAGKQNKQDGRHCQRPMPPRVGHKNEKIDLANGTFIL